MKHIPFPDIELRHREVPPADLSIEHADARTLMYYGLPIARTDTEKAMLTAVLQRLGGRLRFVTPEFSLQLPRDSRHCRGLHAPEGAIEQDSGNWAGTVVYTGLLSRSVRWVKAEYTVPNVAGTTASTAGHSSHWIGIDGYAQDGSGLQLCQCGVDCDNTPKKELSVPYLWIQWFPGPMVRLYSKDFPLSPGDTLLVLLCTAGKGATSATASFVNLTTGIGFTPVEFLAPLGTSLSGETAEWISERPGYDIGNGDTSPFQLGNFGSCTFFNAYAGVFDESGGYTIDGSTGAKVIMNSTNAPVHPLCDVSVWEPGVIRTTWLAQD